MYSKTLWYVLGLLILVLDQLSKWLITHTLEPFETIQVFPGFDLTLRYNKGAAFSFLAYESGWQRWFFIALASIVSMILLIWLTKVDARKRLEGFGLVLILSGAIGNLIDRALFGHVIDFILFYYRQWEYPAFNIADAAICIGTCLLAISLFYKPSLAKGES